MDSRKLEAISKIFIGDEGNCYIGKKGYQLVDFFNEYFSFQDQYGPGFPSRWFYVFKKLEYFISEGKIDDFFTTILDKGYLMSEWQISSVEAVEKRNFILAQFNRILAPEYYVARKNKKYLLVNRNEDLVLIGRGGYAEVYRQESTHQAVKKLKEELLCDAKIRERFKQEFEITHNLNRTLEDGIINAIKFDDNEYEYTMELADCTLKQFIDREHLSKSKQEELIRKIIEIMKRVHDCEVIHRDLSPTNIFLVGEKIKIGDFGLGKVLSGEAGYQTTHTGNVGQYLYTAPEQLQCLKKGDKRSDVFSLGKIINFIMNGNPLNSHHYLKSIVDKATANNPKNRYQDAGEMLKAYDCFVDRYHNSEYQNNIIYKINNQTFDEEVQNFIETLNAKEKSMYLSKYKKNFLNLLLGFMELNEDNALEVVQNIDETYRNICQGVYESYDIFSDFAFEILNKDFPYSAKSIAADILAYIAYKVRRFRSGDQIKKLQDKGLEPLLEEKLVHCL